MEQAEKLEEVPDYLDRIITIASRGDEEGVTKTYRFEKMIEFDLPKGWDKNFSRAVIRAESGSGLREASSCLSGLFWMLVLMIVLAILIL